MRLAGLNAALAAPLLDGDQEYLINCQWTPDYRDEVNAGCDQALETLEAK